MRMHRACGVRFLRPFSAKTRIDGPGHTSAAKKGGEGVVVKGPSLRTGEERRWGSAGQGLAAEYELACLFALSKSARRSRMGVRVAGVRDVASGRRD